MMWLEKKPSAATRRRTPGRFVFKGLLKARCIIKS
jgi:hypothetical protein